MKQLPNPKPGEAMIRVQFDKDEMTRLIQPVLTEVNTLRRRVDTLEEESRSQLLALAELEATVSRLTGDSR